MRGKEERRNDNTHLVRNELFVHATTESAAIMWVQCTIDPIRGTRIGIRSDSVAEATGQVSLKWSMSSRYAYQKPISVELQSAGAGKIFGAH